MKETEKNYHIAFKSSDNTSLLIDAKVSDKFNNGSVFENLETASEFFENGDICFSPKGNKFQGLKLQTFNWSVRPMEVLNVKSSFFENKNLFPQGSISLIMLF